MDCLAWSFTAHAMYFAWNIASFRFLGRYNPSIEEVSKIIFLAIFFAFGAFRVVCYQSQEKCVVIFVDPTWVRLFSGNIRLLYQLNGHYLLKQSKFANRKVSTVCYRNLCDRSNISHTKFHSSSILIHLFVSFNILQDIETNSKRCKHQVQNEFNWRTNGVKRVSQAILIHFRYRPK